MILNTMNGIETLVCGLCGESWDYRTIGHPQAREHHNCRLPGCPACLDHLLTSDKVVDGVMRDLNP